MTAPWLTVVGIGDDGLDGIPPAALRLIEGAELLVGGDRHQAFVAKTAAERLTWAGGLEHAMDAIEKWRGRRVVVLATGDPMCFGAGTNLQRRFDPSEMVVVPVPGALSLACSRMLWPLPDVDLVTLHGRPLEGFHLHVHPGARLVVLSRDGTTPAAVAAMLRGRGFGPSRITVLEHMGGPKENRIDGTAEDWAVAECAALNTLAVECVAGPGAVRRSRVPGLSDDAYETDGQLTKREVRAVTLAALAPEPGELLWDVGGGSGSIAVEWMRAARGGKAVAVERNLERCARIARNALALGVPTLEVVEGEAPAILGSLGPAPDAVFVGGGVSAPGLLEAAWAGLKPGGRLVANAVTLESERRLIDFQAEHGGTLRRIEISHPKSTPGGLTAWEAKAPVTQLQAEKP